MTSLVDGYEITTNHGAVRCAALVVATGACSVGGRPPIAAGLPDDVASVTPQTYRRPDDLDDGGVLVVGASATGVQLAEEIQRSGRHVTLAAGEHVRMPRTYRGRDIFWWTDAAGVLDERYDALDDIVRARHLPSPQLIGTPQRRSIDLNSLRDLGVGIVGRLGRIRDGVAQFSGSLPNTCALADLKLNRLLSTLDQWATQAGIDDEVDSPERFEPTRIPPPRTEIDLGRDGIRTVVWATGYRPDHRWIDLPVFDHKGGIRHDGGAVRGAPGMYVLGLNVLRRRGSSFIGGAARDTAELAADLHLHLDALHRPATSWPDEGGRQPLLVALGRPAAVDDEQPVELGRHERVDEVGRVALVAPRDAARRRGRASGRSGLGPRLAGVGSRRAVRRRGIRVGRAREDAVDVTAASR